MGATVGGPDPFAGLQFVGDTGSGQSELICGSPEQTTAHTARKGASQNCRLLVHHGTISTSPGYPVFIGYCLPPSHRIVTRKWPAYQTFCATLEICATMIERI